MYRLTLDPVHTRAYCASLGRFGLDVVHDALREAQTMYPDHFPTAPQLSAICGRIERSRARPTTRALPAPLSDDHLRGRLPETNRYEQLARRWEKNPPTKREGERWTQSLMDGAIGRAS